MSVQDDAREDIMVMMFNLEQSPDRARHDPDAFLDHEGHRFLFELKSTTTNSMSTVRDFGPEHIKKWIEMHWIVGFFKSGLKKPTYCYYLTPMDMKEWTDQIWDYIKLDFNFAEIAASRINEEDLFSLFGKQNSYSIIEAKKVHKNQYSANEYREKCDLPGGISKVMMDSVRCPFVSDEWFKNNIGTKDLFSIDDLGKLVDYQASAKLIVERTGLKSFKPSEISTVFPKFLLGRLSKKYNGDFTVAKAASEIRWLKSKTALKEVVDIAPSYSVSAMLEILRDRCKYLINRGSTLNNPHISEEFFERFDKITEEHAKILREKLTKYLTENPPAELIGDVNSAKNLD